MWYLIKDVSCGIFSVRYYKYTDQTPTVLLGRGGGSLNWTNDITLFTGLYITNRDFTDFMTIDDMVYNGSYNIIPLPSVSPDITSIAPILEAYPELFI